MKIGFLLFPNVTQLDFTGPLQVLHRLPGSQVHIIAATTDPVPSDCGLWLVPTITMAECPQLDLICVPGGFGVEQAMADEAVIGFVRTQAGHARYVTSVCTGSLILGVAGLLAGRQATTHWAYHHLLAGLGAIPVAARVVRDGNLFTGGGVTAGIDFALTVAAEIAGPDVAQRIQLSIEYDPAPPFASGHPSQASPETRETIGRFYDRRLADFEPQLAAAFARFNPPR